MVVSVGSGSSPAVHALRPPVPQKAEPPQPAVQPQGAEGADLENDGDSDDVGAASVTSGRVIDLIA